MTRDPSAIALLHRLLDEVLEIAPEARDAWLARVRTEHPELAAELEAILSAEPELDRQGFLAARPWTGPPGDADPAVGPSSLAGQRIGAFTLEHLLGSGGMGSVWLAHRSDGRFEGHVAIKLLNLALLDPVGSERFRREGSMLARLTHPNIARLIDAGVADSGQPYLVLEHVAGVRIDRYADARRLPPAERIRLFQQVLAAVEHAHANLIVHRDLKASNILVTDEGAVKLLDFGIAKLLEGETAGAERTELTERGGVAFTPEYAAPEQVTGGVVTTATDVYALGVLLYLLLAGRHPTAPGAASSAQHVRSVVDTEPPRLSAAVAAAAAAGPEVTGARASSAAQLRRLYLGDLDNILAKALRKVPAERYRTAAAFNDDLRRFLRTEPVSARADSLAYRAGKFLRRNRVAVLAGTLAALALVATTAISIDRMREARVQRDAALYAGRRAEAQSEFQELLMSQVSDRPMTMREIVDQGRVIVERQYEAEPRLLGSMLLQLSRRYAELGDVPERKRLLQRAESLALAGGRGADLVEVRCEVVDHLRTQGEYDSAWTVLRVTDSLRHRYPDPIVDEACLGRFAELALEVKDVAAGYAAIRENLRSMERRGRSREVNYFGAKSMLADALVQDGKAREAVGIFRQVLAGLDSTGRRRTTMRAILEHNFATMLTDLGEGVEAERRFHEVLVQAAASDPRGQVHPQPLIHYAEAALTLGLADSAAKYFAQLVEQAARDSSRYWEGRGTFGLARAQASQGLLDAARRTAERFRRLRHGFPRLTSTDDQLPDTLAVGGWLSLAAGDSAAAHALFLRSLRANGFFEGTKQLQQRAAAVRAAETAIGLGHFDLADTLTGRALAVVARDSVAEAGSGLVGEVRLVEGRVLLARGDTSRARERLERAVAALRNGFGAGHPRTIEAAALLSRFGPPRSTP